MSLGKTLLKVAIGIAIAKGVSSLTKGGSATAEPSGRLDPSPGRGTRFDGPQSGGSSRGGLEDILGEVLGSGRTKPASRTRDTAAQRTGSGSRKQSGGTGGGLGDLLDQLSGQKRSAPRANAPKGGLDDLLGQLTGRSTESRRETTRPAGGGVGDLLDQVLADKPGGGKSGGGLKTGPITLPEPEVEEELSAALMLRAVIQAVKCDGDLDEDEKSRLMKAMGEADQREIQAVQAELQRPVDVKGLARAVPAGLEPQIYIVSLMAIDLDHKAEAEYLHALAGELDLSPDQVNAIHDKAGAPRLYR
jgi:uncharacterized membrane protein YebE (DUF533 family)